MALESSDTTLAEIADALAALPGHRGGRPRRLPRHARGAQGLAHPTPAHRQPGVHQHLPSAASSSRTFVDLVEHTDPAAQEPRARRRQGQRAVPRPARAEPREREPRAARRPARAQDLVHAPPTASSQFLAYNDLEEVYNQKYKDIDQVRQEYPHIVQVFKNARFPPEIVQGLSNGARRPGRPAAHRAQLEPARGPRRLGLLGQVQEPVPRQPGPQGTSGWPPCSTPSPRSTPRSSAPTPSSTAPSAGCSTSTRRWGS